MQNIKQSNQNTKLKEVLQLFLSPNYTITSTTYLDILLSHIEKSISNNSCISNDIDKKILQNWISELPKNWTKEKKPCQAVIIFTLKLVGLIGRNEYDFIYWYRENIFTTLCEILDLRSGNLQASVKMAYISMLLDFLNHSEGRQWIIESGVWRDVLKFCHSNHTLYVTRESQKFIWKLLLLESANKPFCEQVILTATEPFIKNTFSPQIHPTLEDNYLDQNELLLTIIDLITAIMENTLFSTRENTIPLLLESATNLESRIKGLFEACISTKFFAHITKLLYLLVFMRFKEGMTQPLEHDHNETWKIFWGNLRYIDSMLLAKKYILDLITGKKLILTYWKKLNDICEIEMQGQYKLEHQIIVMMVMPLSTCLRGPHVSEDVIEMFVQKLLDITCIYTQRLCYMVRSTLIKEDLPVEHICKVSIQVAMDILNIINRDCAVIIFQMMSYVLKNYVQFPNGEPRLTDHTSMPIEEQKINEKENPRTPKFKGILAGDPVVQCPHLLSALLSGLATIIDKYKFKWQECLETINILSVARDILVHPNVLPKVCLQALTLCKLAIQNFMTPNMALLIDYGSSADDVGPVLFKRIHDPNWEVRDSALEVVNTIATISEDKFVAFQDMLLENDFPKLIYEVAATDGESYVRATALTCIVTFVRINRIWNEKLCNLNLHKMAIELMTNETEAIVRREAVILLKELYVHRKWPKSTVDEIAKAMSVAAVLDLHWEVKVNALQFWDQFIRSHLSDQGMLDGIFPTVTFSKEHKKIVVLDENEIKRRVLKVLDELANQNCLGVLLATLQDDSDFQVCKASAEILKKWKNIFVTYKLTESTAESLSHKETTIENELKSTDDTKVNDSNHSSTRSENHCPIPVDIIDSIINADDMNLLASVYERTMNMNANQEQKNCDELKYIPHVTKEKFLHSVLSYNIDDYIEEKNRWLKTYISSFNSVIEDILVAHEKNNVNDMDCY